MAGTAPLIERQAVFVLERKLSIWVICIRTMPSGKEGFWVISLELRKGGK
jgi:hypothetical protein